MLGGLELLHAEAADKLAEGQETGKFGLVLEKQLAEVVVDEAREGIAPGCLGDRLVGDGEVRYDEERLAELTALGAGWLLQDCTQAVPAD